MPELPNPTRPAGDVINTIFRYKLAFSQSRIASYLFDGSGYALINNMERRGKFGVVTRFDIAVRTVANNGTLFLMVNGVRGKTPTRNIRAQSRLSSQFPVTSLLSAVVKINTVLCSRINTSCWS